ncbi:MAG: hypothetical protein Q8M16_13420 [Pirellulaceae bacterium]|nr:hypothetical protein [Pirellulaceae bacterium]
MTEELWETHYSELRATPISEYRLDRARKLSGIVTCDGSPVAGAEVRLINVEKTLATIRENSEPIPLSGSEVIEATTTTKDDGTCETQGLSVGVKAVVGQHLVHGQGFKSLVIVQDGVGSRANIDLVSPRSLRVELPSDYPDDAQVHFVGPGWSPITHTPKVTNGKVFDFDFFDDRSSNGLVLVTQGSLPLAYGYTAAESSTVDLVRFKSPANWKSEIRMDRRWLKSETWNRWQIDAFSNKEPELLQFYAYSSPLAAILSETGANAAVSETSSNIANVSGLTITPHSPVIVSSISGQFVATTQSDEAMEFHVACPPGAYVVRTFGWNGQLSHMKVAVVAGGQTKDVLFNRFEQWGDFIEKGRIVGVVDSSLAKVADQLEVVIQDAENFRRFIHRIPVKDGGFVVGEVPLNRPYIGFVSLKDSSRVSHREFFSILLTANQCETMLRLNFNNNSLKVIGQLPTATTIVAQVQTSSGANPENLFTLSELKDSYEIVNLPTDLPITIEIRNESQVLSQSVVTMEPESKTVVQIHDVILKVVGP